MQTKIQLIETTFKNCSVGSRNWILLKNGIRVQREKFGMMTTNRIYTKGELRFESLTTSIFEFENVFGKLKHRKKWYGDNEWKSLSKTA